MNDETKSDPFNNVKSKTSNLEQGMAHDETYNSCTNLELETLDILDALPFYVLLIDKHHCILHANSATKMHLGLETKDIIGKYCPKIIHGLDEPFYACPLEEAVEKRQAVEREVFDPVSGYWVNSAVYPTGRFTRDGRRIYLHMISDITDRKRADEQLRASREQLRSLSAHLESVREEERKNVAREIHDELGQILTALKFDVSSLTGESAKERQLLLEKAKSICDLIDMAIDTVKRITAELRPPLLDDLGITVALEWQAGEFEKRTQIRCAFSSKPKDIVLDSDRSTAIFRIFQEALTNVVRHSGASKVKAALVKESDKIVLTIKDNGKGIEEKQTLDPKAFGIIGMRERASFLGGQVRVSGSPVKGTSVMVSIPLTNQENPDA